MSLKHTRQLAKNLLDPEKDFEVEVRVKNNHLRARRAQLGLTCKQLCEVAKLGVTTTSYGNLENMRLYGGALAKVCRVPDCDEPAKKADHFVCVSHLEKWGTDPEGWPQEHWPLKRLWGSVVRKLAKFYGCTPDELIPAEVLAVNKKRRIAKVEVAAEDLKQLVETVQLAASQQPLQALLQPDEALADKDLKERMEQVVATLTDREATILRARFGLGDEPGGTLEELGRRFGVSSERVRGIEAKALRKLRHPARSNRLKPFADRVSRCHASECELPGGYSCPSGTPYCYKHTRTLEACDCWQCCDKKYEIGQAKKAEKEKNRIYEEHKRALSIMFRVYEKPESKETPILVCAHHNRSNFRAVLFRLRKPAFIGKHDPEAVGVGRHACEMEGVRFFIYRGNVAADAECFEWVATCEYCFQGAHTHPMEQREFWLTIWHRLMGFALYPKHPWGDETTWP